MLIGSIPLIFYLALVAVAVLLLVRYRGIMRDASRRVTRAVWCPMHDRRMTATLEEAVWDGRRLDVEQCSRFTPASAVTCGKACLRHTTRPRAAPASSLPLLF